MGTTLTALVQDNEVELEQLQDRIGYRFRDLQLLQLSLVHSSFAFERLDDSRHNETLEFLGDAVLDLIVGFILFVRFPELREGKLTRIRSALVNEGGLTERAREIDLGSYLLLGKGESASSGRDKPSILSGTYEALVGAIFLDGGYDAAQVFVRRFFEPYLNDSQERLVSIDAKSELQELLQERYSTGPEYVLVGEEGPAHARLFSVAVRFQDEELGTGTASSKKEAEQQAARTALKQLRQRFSQP
ncbi:ribonuclease III [Desulfobulbus oligotrophicus]|uniref:Ribonuclease 3 n=1 Tax=Desulfobulbus oligotrophicus TaxID=1909699 RepID=A0A7T5VBD7_9BACT|nr:ribonuclease III [Desulfobulbus oligotrophicus]QQG64785.1 ribonuclease III [Desulfobulbus oligotrophicus]